MATTTPNFGWSVPTSTDLVKDGATAIETLGDSIDASLVDLKGGTTGQVLKKNSGTDMDFIWGAVAGDIEGVTAGVGITGGGTSGTVTITNDMATTITAAGDIVVGTGSGTYDNLPIGTTDQVLTADTTVTPYKVKWASASAAATSYTLINTGGTSLTGATTITITGLSGYNKLAIYITDASALANAEFTYRLNGDTGSNYDAAGMRIIGGSGSYDPSFLNTTHTTNTFINFGSLGGNTAATASGMINIDAANSTGVKVIRQVGGGNQLGGAQDNRMFSLGSIYSGASVISSFSFISDSGNFDNGTIYIYGAN
jgi:hypothetical protein